MQASIIERSNEAVEFVGNRTECALLMRSISPANLTIN